MFNIQHIIILLCLTIFLNTVSWTNDDSTTLSKPISEQPVSSESSKQSLNPSLKYPDLISFEKAIGQKACLLKSEHIYFFAPKFYEAESKIIFPYLIKAYDALKEIVGIDTEYIIVVYNFPKGHSDAWGGTSNCTLWYDDSNLKLYQQEEWKRYKIPHVSGYIEEMAHNFVSATKAQFGWEMIGWSIGTKVSAMVAGNPYHTKFIKQTREEQEKTFKRYVALGFTFPSDIPSNLVDRIHAYLLYICEQKYGQNFWKDFFKEIIEHKKELDDAVQLNNDDAIRNERYRITVECFNVLQGINFKELLERNGISTTIDIKSLHPTNPNWNHKLKPLKN